MNDNRAVKKGILIEAVIALVLFIPTLICITIGVYINYDISSKMKGMVKTTATVSRVETEFTHRFDMDEDDDGSYLYTVYVEYMYNGELIEVMSDFGDDDLSEGDVIDYWYDPEDPTRTSAGLVAVNKSILPILLIVAVPFGFIPMFLFVDIIRKIIFLRRNRYIDYGFEPDPYYKK